MTFYNGNPRARVSTSHPESFASCDRCGFVWNLNALQWQFQWRGGALSNTRILVCRPCLDVPQEQLRTIIIPPDPLPVLNARPAPWASEAGPPPPNVPVVDIIPED